MIAGNAQNGFGEKALGTFKKMPLACVKTNSTTLDKVGALEQGMDTNRSTTEKETLSDVLVATVRVILPLNLNHETSLLPSWIVESSKVVRYIDSNRFLCSRKQEGHTLALSNQCSISQTIKTATRRTYNLKFLLGDVVGKCQKPLAVMALVRDQSQVANNNSIMSDPFQVFNLSFMANSKNTKIALYSLYYNTKMLDNNSLCGPIIDQIKVLVRP
ncbi:protein DUF642 L-GALACTONO-1,4-LACTONE-RESPONSIVE GENE 2-like [Cryptomeria japonica]|uniref:protein DUF642 L-GALACTONO-1,4-LACTONE-RESPONSIVE GENE 2-like n=1 Tax=Cryptomeria japonica TaxID=3369 RepID=UPI0027DAA3B1|nr:protein DUF642 L-GALACTONO-1,4-LACTONE-RESPONSIVE GENE 2-like [Cryptomeria japonica]